MTTLLKRGSRGAAVRDLQNMLVASSMTSMHVDGVFGDITDAAVRLFQRKFGLVVDGVAGPQTMTALKQATTPAKPGKPEPDKSAINGPISESDRKVLTLVGKPPPNADSLQLLDTARPIKELIWHCTATAEGKNYTVADIRAWHKARGWSDIGYHYVVYRDGRIMSGRPIGQIGSHVAGHNTGTVGCSYVGGVSADGKTAKDTRTPEQRASMLWLTRRLARKFPITKVTGHNQYAAKACPSFDVRKDPLGKIV